MAKKYKLDEAQLAQLTKEAEELQLILQDKLTDMIGDVDVQGRIEDLDPKSRAVMAMSDAIDDFMFHYIFRKPIKRKPEEA